MYHYCRRKFRQRGRWFYFWIHPSHLLINSYVLGDNMISLWNMMSKRLEFTRQFTLNFLFIFLFLYLVTKFAPWPLPPFLLGWFALMCIMMLMVSVNTFPSFSSLSLQTHSQLGLRWHTTSIFCWSLFHSLLFRLV